MKLRIATTACAVVCLAFGAVAHADTTRGHEDGSFVLANMAPPEPEPPAATPATPPTAEGTTPAANPPAEGTTPEATPPAAPAEATPAEAAPAVDATAEAAPPATDASAPPSSGGMPWLWIAVGVAIAGALGFGLWRRNAGG